MAILVDCLALLGRKSRRVLDNAMATMRMMVRVMMFRDRRGRNGWGHSVWNLQGIKKRWAKFLNGLGFQIVKRRCLVNVVTLRIPGQPTRTCNGDERVAMRSYFGKVFPKEQFAQGGE